MKIQPSQNSCYLFENVYERILRFLDSLSYSSSVSQARQVHACLLKSGASNDTVLVTKLIALYSNHNCFNDASLVLGSFSDPTVHSFSTLIYALTRANFYTRSLRVFSQMVSHGLSPDTHVFPNALKACASLSALNFGKQIHGVASVTGSLYDRFVQGSLLHMYLKCDRIGDSRKVFNEIPHRDVVTCSALLSGYARKGSVEEALKLLDEMRESSVEPNLVSWNGLISGFNCSGHHKEAALLFHRMHSEGFRPDGVTVSSGLPGIRDMEMLDLGIQIHGYVIKQGMDNDLCVTTALIDLYGKCACESEISKVFYGTDSTETAVCNAYITALSRNGLVDKALESFSRFKEQGLELNVVSWTSIIAGCSQNGKDIEALELFREMQSAGVMPNSVTIPSMLPACGNIAALAHGKAAHGFSVRIGISDDIHVGSALIDMYAKCGRIKTSCLCFEKMPTKNLVCWNAIMAGYAMHGKSTEVVQMFQSLQRSGLKPDFISFTSVLAVCSQGGLTDEGWKYFNMMKRDYGIEPRLEHYACMVNLLGRMGKLKEAYEMIREMPFEPDACVWGALLSSCRVHNSASLGKLAAEKLFKLEPTNVGNYVLLSNIYASKAMWSKVDAIRDTVRSLGLKKNPGCSWIQVKNKIHTLLAGDKSHPQMAKIMEKLDEISTEMKKSGYYPDTHLVLQDVEEQEKERILCGHSEKLAVAFGLLNTPPGASLQVIKNLRICGDCHVVIKFISGLESREIFVRDTNRFHHFKDGDCSCGNFW